MESKNKKKLAQEAKAQSDEAQKIESILSYSVGSVIVIGMLGLFDSYISKKGDNNGFKVTLTETQKPAKNG